MKKKTEKVVDWNYHLSFAKIAEIDDVMYIAGEASNPDKDEDDETMDMESLKGAYDSYMANPVIKFMHDKAPQWRGAIGVVVQKYIDSAGKVWETGFGAKPFLVAKFVKGTMPDWMWKGIQEGNYKGFSIGGKALKKVAGRIYVKSWLETSVVDVPSAHGAFFSVLKMACTGENCDLEKIKTPTNSGKNPETEVEPYQETEEDKKRSSWYNMSEIIRFKEDFPQASFKDIQERFGWEEKYIKELLEKIDSVSDRYTQKGTQVDSFSKGGPGSGPRKGIPDREPTRIFGKTSKEHAKIFNEMSIQDLKKWIQTKNKIHPHTPEITTVVSLAVNILSEKENKKRVKKNTQITFFIKTVNDYILDSFLKGGVGSGPRKGHKREVDNDEIFSPDDKKLIESVLERGDAALGIYSQYKNDVIRVKKLLSTANKTKKIKDIVQAKDAIKQLNRRLIKTESKIKIDKSIKIINDYILDSFSKGGSGSGQKGHTTIKRDVPDIKTLEDKFLSMKIEDVKKKLLDYHSSREILEIESKNGKNGEKSLRATLQSRMTGKSVSFKKNQETIDMIDNFLENIIFGD